MAKGHDKRVVSFEHIHSIKPRDFDKLINAVNPRNGEKILEPMCGYGAVSRRILQRATKQEIKVDITLLDESKIQIERVRKNLPKLNKNKFIVQHFPKNQFSDESFDKIVIKMGIHENPLAEQFIILKDVYRILKKSGKLIVWDVMLNKQNQKLFQNIIRKKDQLAGFSELVKRRYFFTEKEFLGLVKKTNFKNIKEFHKIPYKFSSQRRLEQELQNDQNKLDKLNNFIRKQKISKSLRKIMKYQDKGNDIQFNITKKIYTATK